MRTAILVSAALSLTACFPGHTGRRDYGDDAPRSSLLQAQTTDGLAVTLRQDPRTGDLIIVEPQRFRGQPVAVVNRDERGLMLVTRDVQGGRWYREGGAGGDHGEVHVDDPPRREDDRRDDDHRRDEDHR